MELHAEKEELHETLEMKLMKEKTKNAFYLCCLSSCAEYLKNTIAQHPNVLLCTQTNAGKNRKLCFVTYLTFQKEEHQHAD